MCKIFKGRQYEHPGMVPWIYIIVSTLVLASLGAWQVQRLGWKEDLLGKLEVGQQLMPLAQLPTDEAGFEEVIYRRVKLTGDVKHDQPILRAGVHRDYGKGYYVMAPFIYNYDGNAILINSGFMAGEHDAVLAELKANEVLNPTIVEGVLRVPHAPRTFTPDSKPENNLWTSEDIGAIQQYLATKGAQYNLLPYVIEVTAEEPMKGKALPHANTAKLRLRNDHLGYAVTWFGLALVNMIMFYFFCWKREEAPKNLE